MKKHYLQHRLQSMACPRSLGKLPTASSLRSCLTDFPQVWVLFAKLVAQSTPQLIAESVACKLKMNKTINEIISRLKKYPEADFEINSDSITVIPPNENGFPVTLTDNGNGSFTVAFDFWHEEFDNENEALNCFGFGLSKDCRLKLTKKGNKTVKWTVESNENGVWKEDSTTGLFDLSFWKKTEFEILQNELINSIAE